jgi:hypothetical protein
VTPLEAGRVILATREPYETAVLAAIRDLGLEMHVVFNRGAVMVLPSGVNKATGLESALTELQLSPHNVVGIGDAENDHAFLDRCGCAVAVENALPVLKERADLVTQRPEGAGVRELIDRLLASDLAELAPGMKRHEIVLGRREDDRPLEFAPYGTSLLLAGPSGSGKSTLSAALLERLVSLRYQFCVVDPEGDYPEFEGAVTLGGRERPPLPQEAVNVLRHPLQNVIVNLLGVPLDERPRHFRELLRGLEALREETGRPHVILLDEAHHLAPAADPFPGNGRREKPGGLVIVTVHPEHVSPGLLSEVDLVLVLGPSPGESIRGFCAALGQEVPSLPEAPLRPGEGLAWWRRASEGPVRFWSERPDRPRPRHERKYVEGELEPDRSFYFRGPRDRLNLRVQNLKLFLQVAEGVDDETWNYHLRAGDYSRWFRSVLKDEVLSREARIVEETGPLSARESRERIRRCIEARYTNSA